MGMAKDTQVGESTMQVAEVLSDLVSLRVCDPTAALALVSARPSQPHTSTSELADPTQTESLTREEEDADVKRAEDLVKLHYEVREAHKRGELGRVLFDARAAVDRVVGV